MNEFRSKTEREKYPSECLWWYFQQDLAEEVGPILSMGNTISYAAVLGRMKRRKQTEHEHSVLCVSAGDAVWPTVSNSNWQWLPAVRVYSSKSWV